jgi:uncharacterized protein YndB with AHSA1/START domain
MLKIFLLILLSLVAIIVIVVAIGASLPKSHVVSRALTIRQTPEAVFALLTNFQAAPSWRPDVKQVEMLSSQNGHVRFREQGNNGSITYEVTELQPPQRMVTQIADKNLPFGGSWTYLLTSTADGCKLTITEHGEVYNPVFRFVSRFVIGPTRTIDSYLKNVAHRFGESQLPY